MAKTDVLSRVKQDLAHGHTHLATQRLRTLIAINPDDLELRRMLAAVYRQTGNLAESGRWAFLTEDLSATELAAFERANPDPWLRLRMLRWSGKVSSLDTGVRQRLRELETAARQAGPPSAYQGPLDPAQRRGGGFLRGSALPCLFVLVALGALGVLGTVGFLRVVAWVLG